MLRVGRCGTWSHRLRIGENMATRKKIQVDFEYEEVLDAKTRRLVHIGSAVAAGCPT